MNLEADLLLDIVDVLDKQDAGKEWSGQMKHDKYKELKKLLGSDVRKLVLANHLAGVVFDLKQDLLKRIFVRFDEKLNDEFMKSHGLLKPTKSDGKLSTCKSYAVESEMEEFFRAVYWGEKEAYIGLTRICTNKYLDAAHKLCLRIETMCDGHLYAQITVYNGQEFIPIREDALAEAPIYDAMAGVFRLADWESSEDITRGVTLPIANNADYDLRNYKIDDSYLLLYDDAMLDIAVEASLKLIEDKLLSALQ